MSRPFASNRPSTVRLAAVFLFVAITISASARTRPHYGGALHIESDSDPLQKPGGIAWRLILDSLTRIDPQGSVQPALALRWTSENSDHRWQFWLRPGVTFHNGRPFNALAVIQSLEDACRSTACPWTAVRPLGESIVFTGDNPMPSLSALLAGDDFLIRDTTPAPTGTTTVAGTGPFRMKDSTGDTLQLEANDDSWQGRPFVDAIEIAIGHSHDHLRDQWTDLTLSKVDLVEILPADVRQARLQHLDLVVSPPVTLLALEIRNANLAPQLRAAIALAVDRTALYQVIFQKQGEVTASLLPAAFSGYSFLFPADRDLTRAQALRGGLAPPPLTLAADGSSSMQLAAERLALNLHDAGFNVRVIAPLANGYVPHTDLVLRTLPLEAGTPSEALEGLFHRLGQPAPAIAADPVSAYKAEREVLDQHAVIPLLYLPRVWAVSSRLRDLQLTSSGVPDIANISIEAPQ